MILNCRFDATKTPIRRLDSGPSRRETYSDSTARLTSAPRPAANTNVEIVYVNSMDPPPKDPRDILAPSLRAMPTYQDTNRRSEDITAKYHMPISNYQNVMYQTPVIPYVQQPQHLVKAVTVEPVNTPKGESLMINSFYIVFIDLLSLF